jgi:uncharacterized protein (DUF433 family)
MILSIDLIESKPEIRSGRPIIAGTTVTVADVAIAKVFHGQEADGIAEWYDLTLPQVYAALSYYYAHKEEIDVSIREHQGIAAEMKEKRVGSRHTPLFG